MEALRGIRILDMTHVQAGPTASQLMAWMGADVIKLESPEGKAVFVELLKKSDILMENFGPGVLDRFGFTWEKVHEINPRVVMGSIKGFGSTGPYADFKAYENVAQAMGGSMSTT